MTFKNQFWLFKKQKANSIILLFFFLAGIYGLYQGFVFKSKQIQTIENFKKDKTENLSKLVQGFTADTTSVKGKEAYENATNLLSARWDIALPTFKTPTSTAIFCIGQADVFPYYYTIKIESLFMQFFKQGEILNPLRSLSGHFDVSFWVIYLLPLLIIILCFNCLSSELDNDNWRLINSQGISKKEWLQSKFLLVSLLIEIVILLIIAIGLIVSYNYFNQMPSYSDFLFFIGINLYSILWFSILYCINIFGKNTSTNALYSGILWTTICIVIPTLSTAIIETIVPVDNTIISRLSRRPQGSKFDDPVYGLNLMKQFVAKYPEYKNANIDSKTNNFSSAVYQAYHRLMDDANTPKVKHYFGLIECRQNLTNLSCLINPSASIDGIFTSLASNDAFANHDFAYQTKDFHHKLNNIYYKALFFDRKLTISDYEKFPVFESQKARSNSTNTIICYIILAFSSLLIFVLGNKTLKKR